MARIRSRLYTIWMNMKMRCNNKNATGYRYWGGKGITVCVDWVSFKGFENWALKNGYSNTLQLDRINNEKEYSPENCRWVTTKEQSLNRSCTRLFKFKNKIQTLGDWSRELGIKKSTLSQRYYTYGWSLKRVLTKKI